MYHLSQQQVAVAIAHLEADTEGVVSLMNVQIIHFLEMARITAKDKTSHLGERGTFSHVVQPNKEALLPRIDCLI
jgi:hypothetical protein